MSTRVCRASCSSWVPEGRIHFYGVSGVLAWLNLSRAICLEAVHGAVPKKVLDIGKAPAERTEGV